MLHRLTQATPVGPFSVLLLDDGRVCAAGFTAETDDLLELLPSEWRRDAVRPVPAAGGVAKALAAYFAGELDALDDIPVAQRASPFQRAVWQALRGVRPGAPLTYGELAACAGNPAAVRAAGTACGRNPIAVIVPCHRVVRTGGGLGGYLWGVERKRWLLAHESRVAAPLAGRPVYNPLPASGG